MEKLIDPLERYKPALKDICNKHGQLIGDILSKGRKKETQKCRAECYAFMRYMNWTYEKIAKHFDRRSHRSVIYSIEKHFPHKDKLNNIKLK